MKVAKSLFIFDLFVCYMRFVLNFFLGQIHKTTTVILILLVFNTLSIYGQVYTGVATYFDGIATPFGGCGVPEGNLETDNYVALNVYNSPGVGTMWTRPIVGADLPYMGEYKNGNNCGRWVRVRIGENCIGGINDGMLGRPFCQGGTWVNDAYSGASLDMLVTDACGDNNGWCRDSPFHLDIRKVSLNRFVKAGLPVGDLFPLNWNNRKIYWEYIVAPTYTGDIAIYFLQNTQYYWPCIMINHLENGIHSVEQKIGSTWTPLARNSDMGQAFILQPGASFCIRVKDVNDNYIKNYREYCFSIPPSCGAACGPPATLVSYTTFDPVGLGLGQEKDPDLINGSQDYSFWWPDEWGTDPKLAIIDRVGRKLEIDISVSPGQGGTFYKLKSLSSGIYLYTIQTAQKRISNKLLVE